MKLIITGATGLVGRAVLMRFLSLGHDVVAVSRTPQRARAVLGSAPTIVATPSSAEGYAQVIRGANAIVHLAGEPIADKRWSRSLMKRIESSRVDSTELLVEGMAMVDHPPPALIAASAIGYYGDAGDAALSEDSGAGSDFLATVCDRWERAARGAERLGTRVVSMRIGIVLDRHGGALAKLVPIFRAGLGGPLGSGRQFVSWIHLDDLIDIIESAVFDSRFSGAINAVAPTPVRNTEFTHALAGALQSKARIRVPALALRARLGRGADVLLASLRVTPNRLQQLHWQFRYPDLHAALASICQPPAAVSMEKAIELPDSAYLAKRGATYRLHQRTRIEAPLSEVFEFFSRAENLGAITPPEMSFAIQTPTPIAMKNDQIIDYRIRFGPVPMRWRTVIESWQPNVSFVDTQTAGPYRSWWHEHRFEAEGDQTLMEDTIYYSPPLGWLGGLANRLFIRRTLERIFGYRAHVIARRFASHCKGAVRAA